jgi:hypothetical protein
LDQTKKGEVKAKKGSCEGQESLEASDGSKVLCEEQEILLQVARGGDA